MVDLIVGEGVKHLVDVSVDGEVFTATDGHPFWVDDRGAWVDAGDLVVGDVLLGSDGSAVVVDGLSERVVVGRVHNLTVEGVHTYYVVSGDVDALTHNQTWGCFSDHFLSRLARRGVSEDVAWEIIEGQPGFSYWHDGLWKTGYYDPIRKIFIGQGPDGGFTTVITNASRQYIDGLMAARP